MKVQNDPQALLRSTKRLLDATLEHNSVQQTKSSVPPPDVTSRATNTHSSQFEKTLGSVGAILSGPTPSKSKPVGKDRGLTLGTRLLQRVKTSAKLATLGTFMALSMLASPQAHAQSTPSTQSPLMTRVQMMTHNLDRAVAKNVRTDFVMTNVENRNEGIVEFRIKDNAQNRTLTKALKEGAVTLPAPWGVGEGLGAKASVAVEDGFVVVRANARGSAFSSIDRDPMVLVDGNALSGTITLDVKKMTVNENAFYQGLSQSSLDRSRAQLARVVDDLKTGVESGTIAPGSDDALGLQSLIETLRENIQVQQRQVQTDWSTTLTIGDAR